MKTTDLANLIRSIRQEKLDEQHGGMGKFKGGAADLQDPGSSPNRPINKSTKEVHHKLEEEEVDEQLARSSFGSKRHQRTMNIFKRTLGNLKKRKWGGNQSTNKRYTVEGEFAGGKTDTGNESDVVTTNSKTDTKSDKAVSDKINTIKEQNKKRK